LSEQLDQAKTNHLAKNNSLPKIAIIGIGNELNGDDAAGVLIVRKIKNNLPENKQILIVEGSIAPENHTGVIRSFKPDWIWLFDAADLGDKPGSVQLIDLEKVQSIGADTHRLAPTLLLSFLSLEMEFKAFLFGINPESVEPFSDVSDTIKLSIEKTSKFFLLWLKNTYNI
jgi:hydrogenase 3 maturation protease